MSQSINCKLEETCELDASIRRPEDPRRLETLQEAVAPGFEDVESGGRIFQYYPKGMPILPIPEPGLKTNLSKSDPFPPHRPRLTQLDRFEYEACDLVGAKILMPHENKDIPRHMTQQFISKLAGCSQDDARRLLDCFIVLEATEKMVKTFCSMARERSADAIVDFLWRYVIGVVEAEATSDAMPPFEYKDSEVLPLEMVPAWARGSHLTLDTLFPEKTEPIEFIRHGYGDDGEIISDIHYEWNPGNELDWEPEETERISAPSTIAYHIFEDGNRRQVLLQDLQNELPDERYWEIADLPVDDLEALYLKHCGWMARQPKEYCLIIKAVRHAENLTELGARGKNAYALKALTRDQRSVLWTEYHQRRHQLERAIPKNITTLAIMKRIEAGVDLPGLGRLIYKAQNGELKVRALPSKDEFRLIWKAWKKARLPQLLKPIKREIQELRAQLKELA